MSDITLLEGEQVFGDNASKVFKNMGLKCQITDFAILLGGRVSDNEYVVNTTSKNFDNRAAPWSLKDPFFQYGSQVDEKGESTTLFANTRNVGARPCVKYSSIMSSCKDYYKFEDLHAVQYGWYPQMIVSDQTIIDSLEKAYKQFIMKRADAYTTDSICVSDYHRGFNPRKIDEFELPFGSNNRYIRFVGDNNVGEVLSDGTVVEKDKIYWINVEPVIWFVDKDMDLAIAQKILFAGVQMDKLETYHGDFDKTNMKKFLDEYFSKEIAYNRNQSYSKIAEETKEISQPSVDEMSEPKGKAKRKENPYELEVEKVSEEDIIKGAIKSNIAVFLHGKSSDGKSARVKQIDRDCVIVYLRNATPDSLNGKSVYNEEKGEMIDIPPSWYKKIKEKCDREPDKLHILFFDELTNAMPSIQGMAFNIILDKEVNGIWKLPSNCRIVAAGNDMDDSLSANEMAEPLFNRFAHVYIETTVAKWLSWAAKPENHIHPAIYAYISYKNNSGKGSEVLRTKFDGKKPNSDPRKWEMASKVLYATGKPKMLRGLIGDKLADDFCSFCSQEVITINRVRNENCKELIKFMRENEMFATALNLSKCDEKDLKVVREFVSELGESKLAMFDVLWSKGEEKRLEKIAKLRLEASTRR